MHTRACTPRGRPKTRRPRGTTCGLGDVETGTFPQGQGGGSQTRSASPFFPCPAPVVVFWVPSVGRPGGSRSREVRRVLRGLKPPQTASRHRGWGPQGSPPAPKGLGWRGSRPTRGTPPPGLRAPPGRRNGVTGGPPSCARADLGSWSLRGRGVGYVGAWCPSPPQTPPGAPRHSWSERRDTEPKGWRVPLPLIDLCVRTTSVVLPKGPLHPNFLFRGYHFFSSGPCPAPSTSPGPLPRHPRFP